MSATLEQISLYQSECNTLIETLFKSTKHCHGTTQKAKSNVVIKENMTLQLLKNQGSGACGAGNHS